MTCALWLSILDVVSLLAPSGSKKQLTALIRAAMGHRGMAVIDVISPCVTFANNDESYKSYNYVKENDEVLHLIDYILILLL